MLFLIEYSCVLLKSTRWTLQSTYEWSLDLLTVIFDRWIFNTNTKGTQRLPSWMNMNLTCTTVTCFLKVATYIHKLHTDMALFKHELMFHTFLRCLGKFSIKWTLIWLYSNMDTLKFFQECSLTTLNLYHKHKKGNSSKYEPTLDLLTVIFDCWIFITKSK